MSTIIKKSKKEEDDGYYHPHIRDNNTHCYYCNLYVPDKEDRTRDHIVPRVILKKTLTVDERNALRDHLRMACKPCNQFKGDKSLEEFIESQFLKDRILWAAKENDRMKSED